MLLAAIATAGRTSALVIAAGTIGALASAVVIFTILHASDPTSIASFKRVAAVLFGGSVLWAIFSALGLLYSQLVANPKPLLAAVYFGAFLTAGFESIVLGGVFVRRIVYALLLGAFHPLVVVLVVTSLSGALTPDIRMVALGLGAWALAPGMLFGLMKIKTPQGDHSIPLFHAFLKTWVAGNPRELERILEKYTEEATVTTKAVKFELPGRNLSLILSGIHPGPFYPVGSYNLPTLLFERARATNSTALTLHRPGGHERNLATREASGRYVESIVNFADNLSTNYSTNVMHGPARATIGRTVVTGLSLGDNLLVLLSSSPYGTDDIDLGVEEKLSALAAEHAFKLSLVDAHNSINPQRERIEVGNEEPWRQFLSQMRSQEGQAFRVGFAHSSEANFIHGSDVSDAGIGVLVIEKGGTKWALVMADSNNAISEAKTLLEEELGRSDIELLELCTSDSHNLAARGLTVNRGYLAMGEDTLMSEVAKVVTELAVLASGRLVSCRYGIGDTTELVRVLGAPSIRGFADAANRSSAFAKRFTRLGLLVVALLFIATIL